MDANTLLELLESKRQRRSEKITHLNLKHPPLIHEITVTEKQEVTDEIASCESVDDKHKVVEKTVIRSMCGWDEAGEITDDHIKHLEGLYSGDVIIEIYKCVVDFGYLGEQGISKAKKN